MKEIAKILIASNGYGIIDIEENELRVFNLLHDLLIEILIMLPALPDDYEDRTLNESLQELIQIAKEKNNTCIGI